MVQAGKQRTMNGVAESSRAELVPNKPMVPTAHDWPAVNPPRPLRRHIGQPLD